MNAIQIIQSFAKFRRVPEMDAARNWRIGYDHLITELLGPPLKGPQDQTKALLQYPREINVSAAKKLLHEDVHRISWIIEEYVRIPLTIGQTQALISFVFSVGADVFKNSTVLMHINALDFERAAVALARYNRIRLPDGVEIESDELTKRRSIEAATFRSDDATCEA